MIHLSFWSFYGFLFIAMLIGLFFGAWARNLKAREEEVFLNDQIQLYKSRSEDLYQKWTERDPGYFISGLEEMAGVVERGLSKPGVAGDVNKGYMMGLRAAITWIRDGLK